MNGSLSGANRSAFLQQMSESKVDVLVIGGGITGAGIALDAATRGYRTALVDMQDFAAGTSSRSTKLVHGGLRYLKNLEIRMVAEVGKERAVVYENGPHVTIPERMLLPIYRGGTFGRFSTSVGLLLYDYLAGVRKEEGRVMFSATETLEAEPLLRREGLLGGGSYVEYRTDDARLTIEVLKKAAEHGALVVNYAGAECPLYDDTGKMCGAVVVDRTSGAAYRVYARHIVNATGPWVDEWRTKDGSKQGKTLHLTKGVHLVIDGGRFPLRLAVYFDADEGRMIFAIPRDGKTYIGTTDTDYAGELAHPNVTAEDRDYLLDAVNRMFPSLSLASEDVESSWSGLRPLIHQEGKGPSEISRRDEIFESSSGLLSIAGGKLTGYRKMAETIVDRIAERDVECGRSEFRLIERITLSSRIAERGASFRRGAVGPCVTKLLPISGGDVGGSANFPDYVERMTREGVCSGLDYDDARSLAQRYGSNAGRLFALLREKVTEASALASRPHSNEEAVSTGMPLVLFGELLYAIEHEMAVKPTDFFIRRTGNLLFNISYVRTWKEPVLRFMAAYYGWSDDQTLIYTEELDRELHNAVHPTPSIDSD